MNDVVSSAGERYTPTRLYVYFFIYVDYSPTYIFTCVSVYVYVYVYVSLRMHAYMYMRFVYTVYTFCIDAKACLAHKHTYIGTTDVNTYMLAICK